MMQTHSIHGVTGLRNSRLLPVAASLATVLILLAPGFASAVRPTTLVLQMPPYVGIVTGGNLTTPAGPAGCAATHVTGAPAFDATTGRASFEADVNVSTTCAGWASGSSFGPNSTSAAINLNFTVDAPLNVSSVLGPNVTTGTVSATENWKVAIGANEGFYHHAGFCAEPYKTSFFYGCQGWSSYELWVGLSVWDNTTHSVVAPSGGIWGTNYYKIRCTVTANYCSGPGVNHSFYRSGPLSLGFVGKLNSTHQYYLMTTFTAYLSVYLLGWKGAGSARVNMFTAGHGAILSSESIS